MVRDGRMMAGFESPAMLWGACALLDTHTWGRP